MRFQLLLLCASLALAGGWLLQTRDNGHIQRITPHSSVIEDELIRVQQGPEQILVDSQLITVSLEILLSFA